MTQYILRFYYFLQEGGETLHQLAGAFAGNGYRRTHDGAQALNEPDGALYTLDYPAGKLKLLAVKTPRTEDSWEKALETLRLQEEKNPLLDSDLYGRLTILTGTGPWEALLAGAASAFPSGTDNIVPLKQGRWAWLVRDFQHGEGAGLCQWDQEAGNAAFLFRGMSLFYGAILRLQALHFILKDHLLSLRREKDEMQKELINILHTKLVMTQASLIAAEKLENEIQGLASAYGKLVGDQSMVADGLKDYETALQSLERQVYASSALLAPAPFFMQLTEPYQQLREDLQSMRDELNEVQENYQAAIDVVQSKIQVINSRTNIAMQEQIKGLLEVNTEMQKQGLVYQYAAGLIEFIVLAYYSHTLWSHLEHTAYTVIPSWIQFVTVIIFSGNIVWATHLIAEYVQGEIHVRRKLIAALFLFVLLFAFVIIGTALSGSHVAGH